MSRPTSESLRLPERRRHRLRRGPALARPHHHQARRLRNTAIAQSVSFAGWLGRVWPRGAWDYKNSDPLISLLDAAGVYDPVLLAEFGNFNLGFTAAARGFGLSFTLSGGGIAQTFIQGGGDPAAAIVGGIIAGGQIGMNAATRTASSSRQTVTAPILKPWKARSAVTWTTPCSSSCMAMRRRA